MCLDQDAGGVVVTILGCKYERRRALGRLLLELRLRLHKLFAGQRALAQQGVALRRRVPHLLLAATAAMGAPGAAPGAEESPTHRDSDASAPAASGGAGTGAGWALRGYDDHPPDPPHHDPTLK